jgi:hypothetical protein
VVVIPDDAITISPGPKFKTAMLLAIVADVLQLAVFPMFVEGALSPADDLLDLGVAAGLTHLLGWHWEFLPSFLAKLVPGIDLVPFWTMAVASVWRKAKLRSHGKICHRASDQIAEGSSTKKNRCPVRPVAYDTSAYPGAPANLMRRSIAACWLHARSADESCPAANTLRKSTAQIAVR